MRFILVQVECPYVQFIAAACITNTEKFLVGVTNGRERDMSQVSGGKSERVPRAWLLLSRVFVSCSCVFIWLESDWGDLIGSSLLHGMPYFPFYRPRESTGYSVGREENEREREKSFRITGSFFSFRRVPPTL